MQSIGKLSVNAIGYYADQLTHSTGEDVPVLRTGVRGVDYYADHRSPARWMGSGLGRAGVEPDTPVTKEAFTRLMRHETITGEAMTRAHACHGTVAGFDHTFSAPKSVSLLYAYGDSRVRQVVRDAHLAAVAEAVDYMQTHCSQSRVGSRHRGGDGRWNVSTRSVDSDGYMAAAFDHFTSRANDPQLHTHVVVINRVWTGDGWRALDGKRAYAHAKAGGTIYQAVLRDHLTRTLGLRWKPIVNGMADIDGFTPELLRHFSTRRSEITEAVERFVAEHGGEAHRRVWQTFTLETRQPKAHPTGEPRLTAEMKDYGHGAGVQAHWQHLANQAPEDVTALVYRVVQAGRQGLRPGTEEVAEAAIRIVERVTDSQAVFTERDLMAWVAAVYPDGANSSELTAAVRLVLDTSQNTGDVLTLLPPPATNRLNLPDGVTLTPDELGIIADHQPHWVTNGDTVRFRALPDEARYTTRLQLEREHQILAAVNTPSPVKVDAVALEASIAARRLVEVQARTVRHLAALNGRLVAVVGPGGSGKTYLIGAYTDAAHAAGHRVIGAATSAAAARKLADDLPPDMWTGTIAMLRHHLDAGTTKSPPVGTVIVVDEASMVSTRDLAWLVTKTDACDGKLVLLGDPRQLPSIDSGGLFHRIVDVGAGVVTDLANLNRRQTLELDRTALQQLRSGDIRAAVFDYNEAGRLHLGRDEYATKAAMVDGWWADTERQGVDSVRMLASRHDEVWMLNQLARVHMTASGQLFGPAVPNRWGLQFQAGDRMVVRDNWYVHSDLRNGQTGTILAVNPTAGTVAFRRDLDSAEITLPKRYIDRSVDHGYAQTIHTAQGQTFEATHLYVDLGVKAEHGYTALSRARGETHLWLNDTPGPLGECTHIHGHPLIEDRVEALVRQLTQSVIEPAAHDQGLPIAVATDSQLVDWRKQLTRIIDHSPIVENVDERLAAVDLAIDQARMIAACLDDSGSRSQVEYLQDLREDLAGYARRRLVWLQENAHILHQYSAVTEELAHRITARVAAYEIDPPGELIAALGAKPTTPQGERTRRHAVEAYAEARINVGTRADLDDPAVLEAIGWRNAVAAHHHIDQATRGPVLRLTG